jgi:hypothetical protein
MSVTPKVLFVHMQKTGGMSLLRRLRRIHEPSFVYPDASDGAPYLAESVLSVDHLRARWPHRRDEVGIVAGHFPLCTRDLLDESFRCMTILREPVERTLSYLRHHRKVTPTDANRPIEEIYDDGERFSTFIHNHMTKMLSLEVNEMTFGALTKVTFTPDRLERAKQNLTEIEVVGLLEDFAGFWEEAGRRFGWELGPPMHINRTDPEAVSASFRARIADDNAMDIELYEVARNLVHQRARAGT